MIATLALATSLNASLNEECRLRHAAVVNAYVGVKAEIERFNTEQAKKGKR